MPDINSNTKVPKINKKRTPQLHEDICQDLQAIVQHFDIEDRAVRERQIRQYKKLKYYWDGFTYVWWDSVAHDWRVWGREDEYDQGYDQSYYDKPVNVFKAYLESIIAALSVTIPPIICYPDDADSANDLETAKAGDKIASLLYKHNDVILKWLHALFIYCTEGLVCCYSYPDYDEKYGTYETDNVEETEQMKMAPFCPNCGTMLPDDSIAQVTTNREKNEFEPDEDDIEAHDLILNRDMVLCPACLAQIDPEYREHSFIVERIVGKTTKPKARQCMEVYGSLFVKTPIYAINQEKMPYAHLSYEAHYSNFVAEYPELLENVISTNKSGTFPGNTSVGVAEPYERWGRLSTQYNGEYPLNTWTKKQAWQRVSSYNILGDEERINRLKKYFPDGVKVTLIQDKVIDYCNENMDDCLTFTRNPLADYMQHDPAGLGLVPIQDMTNELVSLVLQTIEHGIPQTFADPGVVNFNAYSQLETAPGTIYPATPKAGKSLSDSFFQVSTSSLSTETPVFMQSVQQYGQLVSGAMPSLFGGPAPNSSKTAAQYQMSRNQSMQRLQTQWKMFTIWWKEIFSKMIPAYIKTVESDQKYVEKDASGNYINVWIRVSELQGKIGNIELEANEQLPLTWAQKKDAIMQAMMANNPLVMQAMMSAENLPLITQALGLEEFVLPGEEDRTKQYEEIKLLMESAPIPTGDMNEPEGPSVDIDPMVDNHPIHADICKTWAVGLAGRQAKRENPEGYKNVLLHMQRHVKIQEAMQAMQMMQSAGINPNQMQQGQQQQQPPANNAEGKNSNTKPMTAKMPKGQSNVPVQ